MSDARQHVYGPVPSRRLGRSLGVDLVPLKTCTYDCVYCQLGRTTCRTLERRLTVGVDEVVREVEAALDRGARPDFLTISGSGEPTLYAGLGDLIAELRRRFRPIAVLTNGSLLSDPVVRADLLGADLVVPSLDAGDADTFHWVNRPHPGLEFDQVIAGMVDFRREYRGTIWLEVMLLAAVTGAREEVERIARVAGRMEPDRVLLNTATRPPAESFAYPVPAATLAACCQPFGERAEVIAEPAPALLKGGSRPSRDDVLGLLRRRPCTVEDVTVALAAVPSSVVKALDDLLRDGSIVLRRAGGRAYYSFAGTGRP